MPSQRDAHDAAPNDVPDMVPPSEVGETKDVTVPDLPAEEEAMIKLLPQEVSQS